MTQRSDIEWTEKTWNPVRGCTKISPGCKHCYAQTFAERFRGVPGHAYESGFDLKLVPEKLTEPLLTTRPSKIFVNSMSDLFQDDVPDSFIYDAFKVMSLSEWNTFQVLTKRAERMQRLSESSLNEFANLANVWLGVSVEDRQYGLPRIECLRGAHTSVRFLSIEPLLEDLGELNLEAIDWVIVGGESGPGARPMRDEWVQSILEQCRVHQVPFFFKQWGGLRKKQAGRILNGRTYDEFPEIPVMPVPPKSVRRERIAGFLKGESV